MSARPHGMCSEQYSACLLKTMRMLLPAAVATWESCPRLAFRDAARASVNNSMRSMCLSLAAGTRFSAMARQSITHMRLCIAARSFSRASISGLFFAASEFSESAFCRLVFFLIWFESRTNVGALSNC